MAKRKDPAAWRSTPEGTASYRAARDAAQKQANETGRDVGLEANDLFKSWHTFGLPARQYRQGFELRCEVVSPENPATCQAGHGPVRA